MKRFLKIPIIVLIVFLSYYIFISLKISFQVDNLIRTCYDTHGKYSDSIASTISYDDYLSVNYRDCHLEYITEAVIEKNIRTFPIVIHTFNKAYAYYSYSFYATSKKTGEELAGSEGIPVKITLEYKNWEWVVIDVFEPI